MHVELVKVYIPIYEPLEVSKCAKCGKVIAEIKELIEKMVKLDARLFPLEVTCRSYEEPIQNLK